MKDYKKMTVGQIVADNIENAEVLGRFGIDFCCHGYDDFVTAVEKAGANPEVVAKELRKVKPVAADAIDFKAWPLDLLCDYIIKIYHRGIRRRSPQILALLEKVCKVHGDKHPSLFEVKELFEMSMIDLEHHLQKEEQVLFPYIYALCDAEMKGAPVPQFHCGSIANPIEVMKIEHEAEGERYRHIEDLTGGYNPPEDACASYRKVLADLKSFNRALHEHIHLENNIVFPEAIALYTRLLHENA